MFAQIFNIRSSQTNKQSSRKLIEFSNSIRRDTEQNDKRSICRLWFTTFIFTLWWMKIIIENIIVALGVIIVIIYFASLISVCIANRIAIKYDRYSFLGWTTGAITNIILCFFLENRRISSNTMNENNDRFIYIESDRLWWLRVWGIFLGVTNVQVCWECTAKQKKSQVSPENNFRKPPRNLEALNFQKKPLWVNFKSLESFKLPTGGNVERGISHF